VRGRAPSITKTERRRSANLPRMPTAPMCKPRQCGRGRGGRPGPAGSRGFDPSSQPAPCGDRSDSGCEHAPVWAGAPKPAVERASSARGLHYSGVGCGACAPCSLRWGSGCARCFHAKVPASRHGLGGDGANPITAGLELQEHHEVRGTRYRRAQDSGTPSPRTPTCRIFRAVAEKCAGFKSLRDTCHPESRCRVQEFCTTCIPRVPISPPENS
jgi:hypothetical protein